MSGGLDYLQSYGPEGIADLEKGRELVLQSIKDIVHLNEEMRKTGFDRVKSPGLGDAIKQTDELTTLQKKLTDSQSESAIEVAKLRVQIQAQNRENKAYAQAVLASDGSTNKLRAQLILAQIAYDKLAESQRENTEEGKKAKAEVDRLTAAVSKLEQGTGRYQRNVGNYSGALKVLDKALSDVRQSIDENTKSGKSNEAQLSKLLQEEQLLNELLGNQVTGFASATAELKNNEKALQAMQAAGLANTQTYRELLSETAQLKDNVGDLKAEIKNLASDTKLLDGAVGTAQLLAGAYGIGAASAELFGDNNEELQKSMVKLQAITTILIGLQQIQNALQKESSVVLFLNATAAKAYAAGQWLLNFATNAGTVAMQTFRAALISTGLGAIIVLLGYAANAMTTYAESTNDAAGATADHTEELEKEARALKDVVDASEKVRNARKGGLDDLNRELNLLKAKGASAQDIFNLEQKIAEEELRNLKIRKASGLDVEKEGKDKKNEIEAGKYEFEREQTEKAKKLSEERQKELEKEIQMQERLREEILKVSLSIKNISEEEIASAVNDFLTQKGTEAVIIDAYVKFNSEQSKAALEQVDVELNQTLLGIENSFQQGLYKNVQEYEKAKYNAQVESAKKRLSVEISFLKAQISYLPVGAKERQNIQAKIDELELKGVQDLNAKKLESDQLYASKKKELLEELKQKEQEVRDSVIAGIQQILSAAIQAQISRTDQEMSEAQKRAEEDKLRINETIEDENERRIQTAAIDRRLLEEQERIEAQRRKLVRQAAIIDRTATLLKLTTDTLQKVAAIKAQAAVLASNPATAALSALALAQIPLVVGSAGIATAGILAAPLPALKQGTQDWEGGSALMFEQNKAELVVEPDGHMWIGTKEGVYDLPRHSKVFSNEQLIQMVHSFAGGSLLNGKAENGMVQQLLRQTSQHTKILKEIRDKRSSVTIYNYGSFQDYINRSF